MGHRDGCTGVILHLDGQVGGQRDMYKPGCLMDKSTVYPLVSCQWTHCSNQYGPYLSETMFISSGHMCVTEEKNI